MPPGSQEGGHQNQNSRIVLTHTATVLAAVLVCALLAAPARGASGEGGESLGGAVGVLIEETLKGEPGAESPAPTALPEAPPAPAPASEPAPQGEPTASGQGSSNLVTQTGEQGGTVDGPASAHVAGAISAAAEPGETAAAEPAAAQPLPREPAADRPARAPLRKAGAPPSGPPSAIDPATPLAPWTPAAHPEPTSLTEGVGPGPPLPPAFVYLAVFASVLAIVVSTRRELGFGPRRRRRT